MQRPVIAISFKSFGRQLALHWYSKAFIQVSARASPAFAIHFNHRPVGSLLQQSSESAMKLMRSSAFAQMMQGLLKNYTEFMLELNQNSMALLGQGQAALVRQAQEATESGVDMTDVRGRRARHAA